jgi:hypothetical protein
VAEPTAAILAQHQAATGTATAAVQDSIDCTVVVVQVITAALVFIHIFKTVADIA